jgi:hypothetical protein
MENDRVAVEVLIVLAVVGIASVIVPYLRKYIAIAWRSEADFDDVLRRIEKEMQSERKRYEERIRELEQRVEFLLKELTRANGKIEMLEKKSIPFGQIAASPARILLICGSDDRFCNADRLSLRRANVPVERLSNATKEAIRQELRRKREDGNPWRRIHVSAHASDQGIALADGIADPAWWNETLNGVTGIVLAACQTMTVADAVAGLVPYVVAVREDIANADASEFVFSFWRGVNDGLFFPEAFQRAIQETPQVAEFVALRTA